MSAHVPDLHYFRGSFGAKDIIPLYRDNSDLLPNLHPDLLPTLIKALGMEITAEEWACYLYGVMAHPGYTKMFDNELVSKDIRVPISLQNDLFLKAVALGKHLLFLHSYGDRFAPDNSPLSGKAKCQRTVQFGMPINSYRYSPEKEILYVGDGEFAPVPKEIWEFEVSGLKILQSWLGYRMENRSGKKTSPLDSIGLSEWTTELTSELLRLLWILEGTLNLYPRQAEILEHIVAGKLLLLDALGDVPPLFRKPPKNQEDQAELDLGV